MFMVLWPSDLLYAQSVTWEPATPLTKRESHAMAYDAHRDRLVLFGGDHPGSLYSHRFLDDTFEWDGQRWHKRSPVHSPPQRLMASMAYDPVRRTVLLFGGDTYLSPTLQQTAIGDTWEWDGQDWHQLQPASSPSARLGAAMAMDPVRGRIWLFGGTDLAWIYSETWEWDGTIWTQRFPAHSPSPRFGGRMAFCASSGRMLLFGGAAGVGNSSDAGWEWDGVDWSPITGPGPADRFGHDLATNPASGRVLMFGGRSSSTSNVALTETWEWTGTGWILLAPQHVPGRRYNVTMAPHYGRGQVVLFGSFSGSANFQGGTDPQDGRLATWVFSQGDWTRQASALDDLPAFRPAGVAHETSRDRFLLVDQNNATVPWRWTETWAVEGDRFRLLQPANSPPPREMATLGYHPGLDRVVLYGGTTGPYFNDTWIWDGTNWSEDTTQPRPTLGYINGTMVYDPYHDSLVMWQQGANDVWEWRGSGWTHWVAATLPGPARFFSGFGFDPVRRRYVRFGGRTMSWPAQSFTDTWEFDGFSWSQRQPAHSPPQIDYPWHSVYVPQLGGVMMTNDVDYNAWLWDGTDWTQLVTTRAMFDAPAPSAWATHYLAYDPGRQRVSAFSWEDTVPQVKWDFFLETLKADMRHARGGDRLTFDVDLPAQAGNMCVLLFSGANRPGIPLLSAPGAGTVLLPLAPDGLLQASLGAGLWMLLDAQGRGRLQLAPIPNQAGLIGLELHAAAVSLHLHPLGIGAVTNEIAIDIIR
jgi:hypothetical protein